MLTSDGNRLDGCIFGDEQPADYRMQFGDEKLPKNVDLRAYCTPVEDQGKIGSCTANACVGALEYHYRKRDGTAPDLSRMFVYFNTRRLKGSVEKDTGAMINEAMAAVMAYGACEAQHWPYDPGLFFQEPPEQAYKNGKLHEAVQYARVPGPQGALSALAGGYPVVYGTFLPQRCYEEAGRSGRIPKTSQQERTGRGGGGHCMLIVGYDLDEQVFIVRNSWGTGWASGGYVDIPFDEMAYWSPPDTFWIILELEPKGNFSLVRPLKDAQVAPPQIPPTDEGRKLGVTAASLRESIAGDLHARIDKQEAGIRSRADELRASITGQTLAAVQSPAGAQTFGATCFTCSGSGTCYFCGGSGRSMIMGETTDPNCLKCFGMGACNSCSGSGQT